jgi:hypothetical protein
VTVSVPGGTVNWAGDQDSFSGVATIVGAASGDTSFLAGANGGYGFSGSGVGNSLDLSAAPAALSVSVPLGAVAGFTSGGNDTFSGIASFVGSSSGTTTLAPGPASLSFTGQGSGNALDLSGLTASPSAPLVLNVSGTPRTAAAYGVVDNNTAALGAATYSFGTDVSSFTASSNATFFANSGGYNFTALGSDNTLDLSSAPTGLSLSVPTGTFRVASVTGTFSGITTFVGSAAGSTTFVANGNGGYTFNGAGSNNTLNLSGAPAGTTVTFNGDSSSNPGVVTGLTNGTDTFSDIQHITGLTVTAPTVTGVSSTLANGAYGVGVAVPVLVTFSEPVT